MAGLAAAALAIPEEPETARARKLELRFHPPRPSNARIEKLMPDGVAVSEGNIDGKNREGGSMPQYTVKMETTAAKWRNVVAIWWSKRGEEPVRIKMMSLGDGKVNFRAGNQAIDFSWEKGQAQVH
jgi:hypothetical protein